MTRLINALTESTHQLQAGFEQREKLFRNDIVLSEFVNDIVNNTPFTQGSIREANLEHTSCTCIFNTFASCVLHVCFLLQTGYKCL